MCGTEANASLIRAFQRSLWGNIFPAAVGLHEPARLALNRNEGEEREAIDLETGGRVRDRRPIEMRSRTFSNPFRFFLFLSQVDSAEVKSWSWIELDPRLESALAERAEPSRRSPRRAPILLVRWLTHLTSSGHASPPLQLMAKRVLPLINCNGREPNNSKIIGPRKRR